DGGATIRTEDYTIAIAPLGDLARAGFIHARAAGSPDPFGPARNGSPRYLTFKMTVESLSQKGPITFQPHNTLLASGSGAGTPPLDYPRAYMQLAGTTSNDPRLIEDLAKFLFDVGVSVPAGGRTEGLLVYPAPRSGARSLRMEMS